VPDLRRMLQEAAESPRAALDGDAVVREGQGRVRRRRQVTRVVTGMAVVIAAVSFGFVALYKHEPAVMLQALPSSPPFLTAPTRPAQSDELVPVAPPMVTPLPEPIDQSTRPIPSPLATTDPAVPNHTEAVPTAELLTTPSSSPPPTPRSTIASTPSPAPVDARLAVAGVAQNTPVSPSQDLEVLYTNTGSVAVLFGDPYTYERFEAGMWVPAGPHCLGPCIWNDVGYVLAPGESSVQRTPTRGLAAGLYRILREFKDNSRTAAHESYEQRRRTHVSVPFEVR
jgi:hypothetical protein